MRSPIANSLDPFLKVDRSTTSATTGRPARWPSSVPIGPVLIQTTCKWRLLGPILSAAVTLPPDLPGPRIASMGTSSPSRTPTGGRRVAEVAKRAALRTACGTSPTSSGGRTLLPIARTATSGPRRTRTLRPAAESNAASALGSAPAGGGRERPSPLAAPGGTLRRSARRGVRRGRRSYAVSAQTRVISGRDMVAASITNASKVA